VFVPALLFNSLLTTQMSGGEISRIALFAVVLTAAMISIGIATGSALRLTRSESSGLTLSMSFSNAANYGLPVALFSFGQEGFDRAVIFAAFSSILIFTVAVFVAARGKLPWKQAILPALHIPVMWAGVAALVLRLLHIELPTVVERSVQVLSGGAVPIIILLLGMQVAGMKMYAIRLPVLTAVAARLLVSPCIALLLVALLQPSPLTAKVLVLEAAMPTAVNVALLAAEFDAEPDLVSSVTLLTTAVSVLTVTGWVAYLQSL
jgi:predicted permease